MPHADRRAPALLGHHPAGLCLDAARRIRSAAQLSAGRSCAHSRTASTSMAAWSCRRMSVLAETWWLLDLAAAARVHPRRGGLGGSHRPARRPTRSTSARQHPKFKGVRHIVHDEPDVRWLLRDDVIARSARTGAPRHPLRSAAAPAASAADPGTGGPSARPSHGDRSHRQAARSHLMRWSRGRAIWNACRRFPECTASFPA